MRLHDLMDATEVLEVFRDAPVEVSDVIHDSRSVESGALFCCIPGTTTDGHQFAAAAVERGAVALLVDHELPLAVPQVGVPSVRRAIGPIAARFFGDPSHTMSVVGITGTNGKTSTAFLLGAVMRAAGLHPAVIGTAGVRFDGDIDPWGFTTPEAPTLQRTLASLRARGADAVAMEVSSHALAEHRVDGTVFAVAVFTNLSHEHLDYHGTLEAYFEAKAGLFAPEFTRHAVVNLDDPAGVRLVDRVTAAGGPVTTYAIENPAATVRAARVMTDVRGSRFRLATPQGETDVSISLLGRFNVENALAAAAAATALGIELDSVSAGLEAATAVPGRFEAVRSHAPIGVIVDYAHTAGGIDTALDAARTCTEARVIAVFGCGGDRDRSKRAGMGEAAGRGADVVVLTTDNPRTEDPAAIAEDAAVGLRTTSAEFAIELDRGAAIRMAIGAARPGDIVVILGKGAETMQEWADATIPFDDRVVAAAALESVWN
ncbi:MAG: UDP-N-acetylmuramoyl-L-alanyl-D-glutamate--2,6-diaminopimelate ligase [Acidimicrobiia bacterium]|nr:UDP-N-acetylmuramoyl-L-alanyl-D-glutamate--2,6-diaminopimelate ligase [Acidimicrobiia bacterium]